MAIIRLQMAPGAFALAPPILKNEKRREIFASSKEIDRW
jgi:hypothetical protein